MLLPWISIAIFLNRIANADLSTINAFVIPICTDGDFHGIDFIWCQKVQSPPWTLLLHCGATGSMVHIAVMIAIDSFVRTGGPILRRLCGFSSLCNVFSWTESSSNK